MTIEVRGDNVTLTPDVQQVIETRCRLGLGRIVAQISTVRIVMRDENGPRKGVDLTCSVDVRMRRGAEIRAQATDTAMIAAAEAAIERAARSVHRAVARRQEFGRESIRIPLADAAY